MDCSEFLGRYLKEVGVHEQPRGINTAGLFDEFEKQISAGKVEKLFDINNLRKGDIVLWYGHVLVILEKSAWYCREGDGIPSYIIIDAAHEDFNECGVAKKYMSVRVTKRKITYMEKKNCSMFRVK